MYNLKLKKGYYFSFFQFLKKAPKNNFGRFAIYTFLIYFAVQIAGPFFSVYMLKELKFNYLTFTLINISQSIASLLTLNLWGKFSDKYGNLKMLKICSFILPLIPVMWIFSSSPIYLILVPQMIAGISWAGFSLAASNFIYDTVSVQRRGICIAYYGLMNGIGIFLGGILGGFLATHLNIKFMNVLLFLFLISGVARLLVALIILPLLREVRIVKKLVFPAFHLRHLNLIRGTMFEIVSGTIFRKRKRKT